MQCLVCAKLSFEIICKECQQKLLKPLLLKRELTKDFTIFSFYKYDEIQSLVQSKYYDYGDLVYNILAKNSFAKFGANFVFDHTVYAINLEDNIKDYSQSAILAKHLKSKYIQPVFSKLVAQNSVKYAGKTLEFRKKNKRDFRYSWKSGVDVILVDDVVTSGVSMLEAKEVVKKCGANVLFGITLVDANS